MENISSHFIAWLKVASLTQVMLKGVTFFAFIYFAFALLTLFFSKLAFPLLKLGNPLRDKKLSMKQIRRELLSSILSIIIFGCGLFVPWLLLQYSWSTLRSGSSTSVIFLEILLLVLWNELHFYANHRMLHHPWMYRFHRQHHLSIVPSPWASYAFHPVEAMLLGSVLIIPMLVHDFDVISILALPLLSLFYNSIGHSNYDFLPWANIERWWLNGSRRHCLHHAKFTGNFGFMLPWMDQVFATQLDDQSDLFEIPEP